MKKRLMAMVAALAAALGTLAVPLAAPASADDGCPGTRYVWENFESGGVVAAQLQAYTAGGGQICVNFVSRNQYSGREKRMSLTVCTSMKTNCGTDSQRYKYYAGPLTRQGPCLWTVVKMYDGYGNKIIDSSGYFGSCD